ncbi:MAG: response regulator [Anaeromyxobacter sp.]
MDTPKRVLVVESDHGFALSLAALFQADGCLTRVAASAAEAELEIATRRPGLVVIRAELPDLSGFSLCARLRHDRVTASLPVILYSSDTPPESLAEHARTPWAANGYLAMPLDTEALRKLAARILAAEEPVESADDAVLVEDEAAGPSAAAEAAPPALPAGEAPPPVPRRPVRHAVTDEDRLFADRVFQSVSEHRDALVAEAHRRRPPPRREQLQTPEGRAELLREELRWREAQIARLSEILGGARAGAGHLRRAHPRPRRGGAGAQGPGGGPAAPAGRGARPVRREGARVRRLGGRPAAGEVQPGEGAHRGGGGQRAAHPRAGARGPPPRRRPGPAQAGAGRGAGGDRPAGPAGPRRGRRRGRPRARAGV